MTAETLKQAQELEKEIRELDGAIKCLQRDHDKLGGQSVLICDLFKYWGGTITPRLGDQLISLISYQLEMRKSYAENVLANL